MRLEWLEDIIAVVETGSFTEASERRGLTQSAFSRRIRHIEDYVGVELFDRSRKPVHLTAGTRAHHKQIVQAAAQLRHLLADLREGDSKAQQRVVICSQHALAASLTPLLLKTMQLRDSDVYVRLRSANRGDCYGQLLSHDADLAIVHRLPGEDDPVNSAFVDSHMIAHDALIPVIAPDSLPELQAAFAQGVLPYIAYPAEVFLGQVMTRTILPQVTELHPDARAETALTLAALEMAQAGLGVTWVPQSLARERLSSGALISLEADLPGCAMEVIAARLTGDHRPAEEMTWQKLTSIAPAKAGDAKPSPGP